MVSGFSVVIEGVSGFPEAISGRTRNTNVGTVSGLSTGIATASESALADPKPCVTCVRAGISASISTSGCRSTSGRACISGFSAELRPSRVCDLRTMVLVGSTRLTGVSRCARIWAQISKPHNSETVRPSSVNMDSNRSNFPGESNGVGFQAL